MKSRLQATLITAGLIGGLAAPALAADPVVVGVTLDTSFIVPGSSPGDFTGNAVGGFSPPFSVVLAVGDVFDLTIDFAGNQTITINGLDSIWAFSFADVPSAVVSTGKFQFLSTDGSVLLESIEKNSVENEIHFGQSFYASDFTDLPTRISFGGARYVGTVVEYLEPGVTSRTYDAPGFAFDAVSFTSVVREPASWALMLAGAGSLAAACRRRR